MTFTENLEKARGGDKRAYGMLCNLSADKLYGIARLVLDNDADAEAAVRLAFDDGFRGIDRINDENHLCAWLSRELTKHSVAKLKEYRSEERTVKSDGSPEKDIFCRLGDLDRLVNALNLAFGYSVKEITVITGLKEETVERKVRDSDKKIGKDKPRITEYFNSVKAPAALITKELSVHDLTVEIDKTDDDGLIGEMERIAAAAEAEENISRISAENPKFIRFEPAKFAEEEAEKPAVEEPKERKIGITPIAKPTPSAEVKPEPVVEEKSEPVAEKAPEPVAEKKPEPVVEEKSEPVAEKVPEPVVEEKPVQAAEEVTPASEVKPSEPPKEIDARTFINVITAQKIKGRDFLKLMGNTRISNDVYREIEQNPNLTKERLIELLENSPLTSSDYYKVLTAVKQRNELLARKEQANVLFDIKSKKEEKEADLPTDTRSFTAPVKEEEVRKALDNDKSRFEFEKKPEKEKRTFDFVKKAEPEIKPFMPVQDVEPDDEDEEDLELDDTPDTAKIPAPSPKQNVQTEAAPEKEQSFREKYKGKEFFLDDDVYYKGVNNGKIIFCAVCAVLLIAGSFGIRYLVTGNALPGGEKPQKVTVEELPESYSSNADIYKAITLTENVSANRSSAYYKSDSEPYTETFTKDYCKTDDIIYIADGNAVIAYSLDAQAPSELYSFEISEDKGGFLGFAAEGNAFYMMYESSYEETVLYNITSADEEGNAYVADCEAAISRDCVVVERYEDGGFVTAYTQDGKFIAADVTEEAVSIATALNTSAGAVEGVSDTYLPSYRLEGQEKVYIDYSSIIVPEKIGYNGFTVIGTLSGSDARASAVLGGSQSFVEFGDGVCRVVISDKNKTYEENFRFVGSNLTLDSTAVYEGECFGAEFISASGAVTYNSAENSINVINASGTTGFALAEGEVLSGAAFEGSCVHITTEMAEGSMLYCVDLSGIPAAAEAKPDAIYSDRLKAYGENELTGLTVESDSEGNRTGLKLSVYGYDGGLKENRSVIITLDEQTDPKYLRYLYADAEESNLRIATHNGFIAVSTVYFDGISEIERVLCFRDDGSALTETTDLLLFDIQSRYRFLTFCNDMLYVITDSRIITIDPETGKAKGYFSFEEQSSAETDSVSQETEETEATIE